MDENSKIINGIIHGNDKEVLNILYKKLLPVLKSYILKNNGSKDDVKDVFQDVLLVMYKKIKLENFTPSGNIINYMFTIAKNTWIKKAVKNQRSNSIDDSFEELSSSETGILNSLITKEKSLAAKNMLDTIGDQCAKLLSHRIYDEMDLEEIATVMGFSNTNVVKSTIYRCKQKLKNKIIKNKGFQNLIGISVE